MFCKHDYEILDKTVLPSAAEQVMGISLEEIQAKNIFVKKVIIILKCKKCKEIKKIVETNP